MNVKKIFFIFCILSSAKIISAMDGVDPNEPNIKLKVTLRPLSLFDNTETAGDRAFDHPVDHKSLLILISEAHTRITTAPIDREPFKALMNRIADKKIDLDRPEDTTILVTEKDLHHRLFPYLLWTGRLVSMPSFLQSNNVTGYPLYLKGMNQFAYLVSSIEKRDNGKGYQLQWVYKLEDFSEEGEVSQRSFERCKQLVLDLATAITRKPAL